MSAVVLWSHILLPFVYLIFELKKKLTEIFTWLLHRVTIIFNEGSNCLALHKTSALILITLSVQGLLPSVLRLYPQE